MTTGDTPRFANVPDVLAPRYDVIICGAGSSGSVLACRLAENPDVRVLLVEAGGSDEVTSVSEASQWPLNLGGELDWNFYSEPDPSLNGRSIPFSMGKVLGGGSSINLMIWARGHRSDWDHFATESGEPTWGYEPVLDLYRSVEDWRGTGEAEYRGAGGPIFVQPAPNAHPLAVLREIGNSAELRRFVEREVMPGDLTAAELETYLRSAVTTYWHESGTAKMGRDRMSVVDGHLRVYGIDNLRVADASIMPRITSGNTMAPCVVIGERASQFIKAEHGF